MPREWVIDDHVGYDGLRLSPCARQDPGPTEIRLRVEAFALNPADQDVMLNQSAFRQTGFPARFGSEAVGVVEAIGAKVKGIPLDARYCTLPHAYDRSGASADTLVIDQTHVTRAPIGLSATEAATIWMPNLTAYFTMIEVAQAAPGRAILVTDGTNAAGTAALKLGRRHGAMMIALAQTKADRAHLQDAGAEHICVEEEAPGIAKFLRQLTQGVGLHAVFDSRGGDLMERYTPAMAKGGLLLLDIAKTDPQTLPYKSMVQRGLWLHAHSSVLSLSDPEASARGKAYIYRALLQEALAPNIARVFPMEDCIEAWRYVTDTHQGPGKVVIETGAKGP